MHCNSPLALLGQQDHIPIVTGLTVALMAAADADALDNFIWFTSY